LRGVSLHANISLKNNREAKRMKHRILSLLIAISIITLSFGFSPLAAADDFEGYTLIDWEPKASSFWDSTKGSELNTTASNAKYFISSKIFTKDELPVGSIIIVDEGYQYRPEGWTDLDKTNARRPSVKATNKVMVTDNWWGKFNYRAFNISKIGANTDLTSEIDDISSHFKIYVPNSPDTNPPFEVSDGLDIEERLMEKIEDAVILKIGNPNAFVKAKKIRLDKDYNITPVIIDGRTLIPVRFISENMNAEVEWDEESSAVTIKLDEREIKFIIGSKSYTLNGETHELDVPAQILNNRTVIPLRALAEALGKKVFWDDRGIISVSDNETFDSSKDSELIEYLISRLSAPSNTGKALKVLAIGNSFSQDATQWLYEIALDAGIDEIILGNLYIGGCTLATHWENAKENNAAYTYYKNSVGIWEKYNKSTMLQGILDEDWDIITLQQASGVSGMEETYNSDLTNLIEYVNTHKTNPNAKLVWHMTWAYQSDSTHKEFVNYENDQLKMYNSILSCVQNKILTNPAFSYIIPTGTAIQNLRTSIIGDRLTRDGYHLSYNLGRYTAALTWFHAITGESIDNITFNPEPEEIPEIYIPLIKKAVKAAIEKPFEITYLN